MFIIFSPRNFVWAQNWRLRIFIKPEQQILRFIDILVHRNNKVKERLLMCKYRSVRLTYIEWETCDCKTNLYPSRSNTFMKFNSSFKKGKRYDGSCEASFSYKCKANEDEGIV